MSGEHGASQNNVYQLLCEEIPGRADDGKPTVVVLDEVESIAVARGAASLHEILLTCTGRPTPY